MEKDGGIIQCNGSDRHIFPSPLQIAMGGEKAYPLELGKQATIQNVYDIFDTDKPDLACVTVLEQKEFYNQWFYSLGGAIILDKILFYKVKEPYGEFSNFLHLDLLTLTEYIGQQASIFFKHKSLLQKN